MPSSLRTAKPGAAGPGAAASSWPAREFARAIAVRHALGAGSGGRRAWPWVPLTLRRPGRSSGLRLSLSIPLALSLRSTRVERLATFGRTVHAHHLSSRSRIGGDVRIVRNRPVQLRLLRASDGPSPLGRAAARGPGWARANPVGRVYAARLPRIVERDVGLSSPRRPDSAQRSSSAGGAVRLEPHEVSRIADQVMDSIDQRLIAYRERRGRV